MLIYSVGRSALVTILFVVARMLLHVIWSRQYRDNFWPAFASQTHTFLNDICVFKVKCEPDSVTTVTKLNANALIMDNFEFPQLLSIILAVLLLNIFSWHNTLQLQIAILFCCVDQMNRLQNRALPIKENEDCDRRRRRRWRWRQHPYNWALPRPQESWFEIAE